MSPEKTGQSPRRAVLSSTPLPLGLRDLYADEVTGREGIVGALRDSFRRGGYTPVTTPAFEYEEVVTKGLGSLDSGDLIRFVEPSTGRVCVLRPDITAQIARLVCTRLRAIDPPLRLCYEGNIIRIPKERSRPRRQVAQAGVELIGPGAPHGEAEAIRLAAHSVRAAGLGDFLVELGDSTIAAAALDRIPTEAHAEIRERLADKDADGLGAALSSARAPTQVRRLLEILPEMYGGREILDLARRRLKGPVAQTAIGRLSRVAETLDRAGLEAPLGFDLGEMRGWGYYTGVRFVLLARGPGMAIASGGRYDSLLGRYGRDLPATGFAIDIECLEIALGEARSQKEG